MNLCDDGHEQICYDARNCPGCELKDKLSDAELALEKERKYSDGLEQKIESLT